MSERKTFSLEEAIDQRQAEFEIEKFFGDTTPVGPKASEEAENTSGKILNSLER